MTAEYQLFYAKDLNFIETQSTWALATASPNWQTVNFTFDHINDFSRMRIDFGDVPSTAQLQLDHLIISYKEAEFEIDKSSIPEIFEFNGYCKYNTTTGVLKTIIQPDLTLPYDPFMVSKSIVYILNNLREGHSLAAIFFSTLFGLAVLLHLTVNNTSFYRTEYLFILFFICVLILPHMDIRDTFNKSTNENRRKGEEPIFRDEEDLESYFRKWDLFFKDNLGFRDFLVSTNAYVRKLVFNSSIKPDKAVLGKDGWMFLFGDIDAITEDLLHLNLLSKRELEDFKKNLESNKSSLDTLGIKYYKFIAPNSSTIYPEYLPDRILNAQSGVSRLDQVINYLNQKKSTVQIIDVRSEFMDLKKSHQLYKKQDSHWNYSGGFYAYEKIISKMANDTVIDPNKRKLSDFKTDLADELGDLANSMAFPMELKESVTSISSYPVSVKGINNEMNDFKNIVITECDSAISNKTLLVFRDSFGKSLIPFLSSHFKKVIYVWEDYDISIVKEYMPDIVLECNVERKLVKYMPDIKIKN